MFEKQNNAIPLGCIPCLPPHHRHHVSLFQAPLSSSHHGHTHHVDYRLYDPPALTLNVPVAGPELLLFPEPFSDLQLGILCDHPMLAEGMQAMVVELSENTQDPVCSAVLNVCKQICTNHV